MNSLKGLTAKFYTFFFYYGFSSDSYFAYLKKNSLLKYEFSL